MDKSSKSKTRLINYLLVLALAILVAVWAAVFRGAEANPELSSSQIYFLDVGQGDSALLSLPQSTQVLIDAGRDGKTVERIAEAMPFFDRKIEFVVISHFDSDHVGGLDEVMLSYDIDQIIIATAQKDQKEAQELVAKVDKNKTDIKYVSRSDSVYFRAPVKGVVLWPEAKTEGLKDNDLSLVMQILGAGKKVLMMGDIENKGQLYLFAKNEISDLDTDVLKFPHHGAGGAFSEKLFELTTPEKVIISVGKNSYGHPSGTLIDFLKNKIIEFVRTDEAGTVRVGL
jgi:beta-lactamase superfamily II metal-dependent hydrolase